MKRILYVLLAATLLLTSGKLKAQSVNVTATHIVSALGAKCLDVENGSLNAGSRIVLWDCGVGKPNQLFQLLQNGQIRVANTALCIDEHGGLQQSMDQIALWPCAQSSSRWRLTNGQFLSPNGRMCIDLRGGSQRWYMGNQDAILYQCNGQANQHFVLGMVLPPSRGTTGYAPGTLANIVPRSGSPTVRVTASGIVAQGGGNLVNTNGSNIVAQGGGNIVAQGGGNVIVPIANNAQ